MPAARFDDYDPGVGGVSRSVRAVWGLKSALIAGFTVVFALWVLWGIQLVRSLREIERSVSTVQETYSKGEEILLRIRTNVLLGSIYLRDALIDGASPRRQYYRELERFRVEADTLIQAYLGDVGPTERTEWARLRTELTDYWASREVAFSPERRTLLESADILRRQVVPRRESVLKILDQLGELQAAAEDRHRLEVAALYADFRGRLAWLGAGTLLVALFAAVLASRRAHLLQRQVERQRRSEQENRHDLERLSARLVNVQEEERRNLARELHDAVGQALTAVKMDIGIALRSDSEPRARVALEEAREIMEITLRGVRDLSQLLHPSTLDDFGLPATLSAYLRSFSARTGIRAHLAGTPEARLPANIEVCVYRIAQEALSNIATHSGATDCTVSLSATSTALQMTIEDNGHGLPKTAGSRRRGLGLVAMRERAQMLGGVFTIDDGPVSGTRIVVTLPLTGRETPEAAEHRQTSSAQPRILAG